MSMFKNPHPDHLINCDETRMWCTCGHKVSCGTRRDAETAAGAHFTATRKRQAGDFFASCRLKVDRPFGQLTDEELTLMEFSNIRSRWDHKLRLEVVPIPCAFVTTDREAFEAHMKREHGRTIARKVWPDPDIRLPLLTLPVAKWKGPKLTEDGTDFTADGKEIVRCECGLYGQLGTASSELWWREHVSMCAERSAVA